jgi:uncharacterized OB-fold protein
VADVGKPVPVPDEASRPFFAAALGGQLLLQRCEACGAWAWPVAPRCRQCFSPALTWGEAEGTGTLYSYVLMHQVNHPGFAGEAPYNVAQVDLSEGIRVLSTVVGVENDELRIGMPLVVTFDRVSDDVAVPKFRPADHAERPVG